MNAIKNLFGPKILAFISIVCFVLLLSCADNNTIDFSANDNANVQSEANSDSQTEETDDMAALAVSSDASTLSGREDLGGRTEITIADERFNCAVVTLEKATAIRPPANSAIIPHGVITIDFGLACLGPGGKSRSGKIIIEYLGRRFMPGSKIITTFQNYSVNGIKLEGTRILTNTSANETAAVSFSIIEEGMKVTYPDGTFATRSSSRIRTWNRMLNPTGDTWTVTGSAIGSNRKGKEYIMTITKPLVYKRSCAIINKVFIPVEGTKELKTGGKSVTIDYGNGNCNNKVTITILGKSKEVELTADGN